MALQPSTALNFKTNFVKDIEGGDLIVIKNSYSCFYISYTNFRYVYLSLINVTVVRLFLYPLRLKYFHVI